MALTVVLSLTASPWAGTSPAKTILLATTTSTRDSGLLDLLIPVFERSTGYVVKTIAVGTGKALAMGKRGDVDIVITHAPTAEKPLVEAGLLLQRVPFMHNDFVIVGPLADPARLAGARNASGALRRIASTEAGFISRGDNSGTHKQEQSLWQGAHLIPRGEWYVESGQGMGATLRIASDKNAYTLTDRSTYVHLRKTLASRILYAGDAVLRNTYSIMLVHAAGRPRVNADGARALHAWMLSEAARDLIRHYGVEQFGQPLFILDPIR